MTKRSGYAPEGYYDPVTLPDGRVVDYDDPRQSVWEAPPPAPPFTTGYVAAIYGSTFLRRGPGEGVDMFYTGPFYGDRIPRELREERRAGVLHYLPHTFAEYPKGDVRRGGCRICGFPGADAPCATPEIRGVVAEVPGMIARFVPEAWVNDNAIEVDAEGPTEWDCTAAFGQLDADYRERLLTETDGEDEALDRNDALKGDPAAPEWVRAYRGPFDIYVRREATA